jgi:transcription elongation GreA/GreB family factor
MTAMKLKQKIYNHYLQVIQGKVTMLQKVLDDLKESGANETKSTAGDKHETALAMLQIEQANTRTQLQEALNQQAALEKINPELSANSILNGSLIKTNRGYLFMSIASGKAVVDEIAVIALSPQSPLGQKLMGLKAGETAAINNVEYIIELIE